MVKVSLFEVALLFSVLCSAFTVAFSVLVLANSVGWELATLSCSSNMLSILTSFCMYYNEWSNAEDEQLSLDALRMRFEKMVAGCKS